MRKIKELLTYFMPKIQLSGRVWDMDDHQGWGDRVGWFNYDNRRVDAHTTPRGQVGDEIRCRMKTGKIARFVVTEVEYVSNVDDMWFATVSDIGYVGEPLMDKRIKEAQL